MTHRIAVIGGDGIGPEVTAQAIKVIEAAGVELETTEFDLGGARYLRDGEILSDEVLAELAGFDAILLGAVGTPEVAPGVIERGCFPPVTWLTSRLHRRCSGAMTRFTRINSTTPR